MKTLLKISSSIILLSVFITINACDSSTDSGKSQNLNVYVKDQNGNPLSNVKVYWYVTWNQFIQGNSMSSAMQKSKTLESHLQSVDLVSFEGLVTEQGVELTWVTNSETENVGFILVRNGIEICSYEVTDLLKGQGTTNSKHVYHYIDRDVLDLGLHQYELKSVNYIGYEELLELDLIVDLNPIFPVYDNSLHQNYPNPFDGSTTISFSITKNDTVNFSVYNVFNQDIYDNNLNVRKGTNSLIFSAQNLANGIYTFKVKFDDFEDQKNMLVMNPDPETLSNTDSLAISSSSGNFTIDPKVFGFGMEIDFRDELNNELGLASVPNTLTLCLIKDGYETLLREVTIDPVGGQRLDFTMVQK